MSSGTAFAEGWLMMAGLIVAIGAQNAQVLRQGLLRRHVAEVVAFCTVSDWLLVAAGVFGLGALLTRHGQALLALRWLGGGFLLWCSWRAARRAWLGGQSGSMASGAAAGGSGRSAALATTAALTWLNPHVYLDTVLLLGTVGSRHAGGERATFAFGAGAASLMWFCALGFGSAVLAPWLARPATWRAVDAAVAAVMGWIGLGLLLRAG